AEKDKILLTLGIEPSFPNTGYGYIESDKNDASEIKKVKQFREKPDYETAKQFLAAENFLWNAAIFIWSVKSIVASFEDHLSEMNLLVSKGMSVLNTSEEKKFTDLNYPEAENISIDYGILEKANKVYLKKATF